VFGTAFVGRINQDVRIDDKHQRPSIKSSSASRFATFTRGIPPSKVGNGGRSFRDLRDWNMTRNADSKSSDMVLPCRADSSFKRFMILSSMLSVVFIWKTIQDVWKSVNLAGCYAVRKPRDRRPRFALCVAGSLRAGHALRSGASCLGLYSSIPREISWPCTHSTVSPRLHHARTGLAGAPQSI